MKRVKTVKKRADSDLTQKTKADFIRWLSVRDGLKQKASRDAGAAPEPEDCAGISELNIFGS